MININGLIELVGCVIGEDENSSSINLSLTTNQNDLDNVLNIIFEPDSLERIEDGNKTYLNYTEIVSLQVDYLYDDNSSLTGEIQINIKAKQAVISRSQYNALLLQVEELENCILEMSEILYGDEGASE